MLGPNYTGLTLWGVPGQEPVPEFDKPHVSESWALTETSEGASQVFTTPISSTPDTWSLSWDDSRFGEVLDIPYWYTDLSAAGIWPHAPNALSAKPHLPLIGAAPTDTWFISWTETPVDTVQFDLFDFWALTYSNEVRALGISQTFPASELWSITFAEVSQLVTTNAE